MATPGKKTVSKKALLNWETELREDYDFIYDESGEKGWVRVQEIKCKCVFQFILSLNWMI